jgi:hypothetical protein
MIIDSNKRAVFGIFWFCVIEHAALIFEEQFQLEFVELLYLAMGESSK